MQKILYGAGRYGSKVFSFYGADKIYAFADMNKAGEMYMGKPVIHPNKLVSLSKEYELIICVAAYEEVMAYLKEMGVVDFYIYPLIDKNNLRRNLFFHVIEGSINDPVIVGELKNLDFIEDSELINKYSAAREKFIEFPRSYVDKTDFFENTYNFGHFEENLYYGQYSEMLSYAGRELKIYEGPIVAHGYPISTPAKKPLYCNLILAGEINKNSWHQHTKDLLCFEVGPYLNYAEGFYSKDDVLRLKSRQGRNLTVFPIHSTLDTKLIYDEKKFVTEVLKEADKFDTLTICSHHFTYNSETTRLFKENGAKIVTAGFIYDPSFIKRLKTILEMSDSVVTNGYGSHIGHALSLNKPVKLLEQEVAIETPAEFSIYTKNYITPKVAYEEVMCTDKYTITQKQLDVYEPSVGFTKTKTKEEMAAIFDLSLRIIQNCDYKKSRYVDSIRQTYRDLQKAKTDEEKLQFRLMVEALPVDYEDHLKKMGV